MPQRVPSRWLILARGGESLGPVGSLQVVSGLVLWLSGGEIVLQEGLNVLESGPLVWLFLPAEPHHFVQRIRAALRTRHPVAPFHLLQHLSVYHACRHRRDEISFAVEGNHHHICQTLLFTLRRTGALRPK